MLPLSATKNFVTLAAAYRDLDIEFPALKGVTLAQWALESGWGATKLANVYANFGGMKWGKVDADFGMPVMYGTEKYTSFTGVSQFIHAYWHRLDNISLFDGWRTATNDPLSFITFITPGWLTGRDSYSGPGGLSRPEQKYVRDVMDIRNRRTEEVFTVAKEPAE